MIIRPVVSQDFEHWLPLWAGYNSFYGRPTFPDEITQITWSRFLDPNEPVYALVAERAGELVGLAHYLLHRSTISVAPVCYLQDLFTRRAARGQGVGGALIEAVYERAKDAGTERVYWQTQETNLTAISLYQKLAERSGFIVFRKQLNLNLK